MILKLPERIIPSFQYYIGIDYSGAETPGSSLKGLRVYETGRDYLPVEVEPSPSPHKYWKRRGLSVALEQGLPPGRSTPDQHDAYAASWLRQVDMNGSLGKFLKPSMLPVEYHLARIKGWILGVI